MYSIATESRLLTRQIARTSTRIAEHKVRWLWPQRRAMSILIRKTPVRDEGVEERGERKGESGANSKRTFGYEGELA